MSFVISWLLLKRKPLPVTYGQQGLHISRFIEEYSSLKFIDISAFLYWPEKSVNVVRVLTEEKELAQVPSSELEILAQEHYPPPPAETESIRSSPCVAISFLTPCVLSTKSRRMAFSSPFTLNDIYFAIRSVAGSRFPFATYDIDALEGRPPHIGTVTFYPIDARFGGAIGVLYFSLASLFHKPKTGKRSDGIEQQDKIDEIVRALGYLRAFSIGDLPSLVLPCNIETQPVLVTGNKRLYAGFDSDHTFLFDA